MLLKISLVIAACSGVSMDQVQTRLTELRSKNPDAQVTLRLDKKAACYKGQILSGKDQKILEALAKSANP